MPEIKTTTVSVNWTSTQAFAIALISLLLGLAGGWFIRKSFVTAPAATAVASPSAPAGNPPPAALGPLASTPTPDQLKKMADTQAAPLLESLKADPRNSDLLTRIGNIYYDVKQYPEAIDYYERSLKLQPANAAVRTDMATAYWYSGNADTALVEFNKALTYEPNKANTLFNIGIVKWQSKSDPAGAIAVWQKLLDANPNYEARDKVQQMINQAKSGSHAPISK
ncbi:MAG TPA: tetratricopeptide repeat protein [Candidatus Acidoferrum sp.]|nr:tetratricopeptide repeat protein [Candidatus Acidoferrum sp.]